MLNDQISQFNLVLKQDSFRKDKFNKEKKVTHVIFNFVNRVSLLSLQTIKFYIQTLLILSLQTIKFYIQKLLKSEILS